MKWKYIIPILLQFMQFSCTEIIDPTLTGSTVQLNAPADSLDACNGAQVFWWSEVNFANRYELQIVSPDFQHIDKLVLDTTITTNQFEYGLAPGNYQWRVSAMNNNDNTPYATRTLTIEDMTGFSSVLLFHIRPADSFYTNNKEQTFSWATDKRIKQYNFTLFFKNQLVDNQKITIDSIHEKLTWGDGDYKWSVQGRSCDSTTETSASSFVLDTKSPETPILQNPVNTAEINDSTVLFKWKSDNGATGTHCYDSLYIYSDSTLKSVLIKVQTDTMSSEEILHSGQRYYWRVKTWDMAGNMSNYSNTWNFMIARP